jgi:hypothetical protein
MVSEVGSRGGSLEISLIVLELVVHRDETYPFPRLFCLLARLHLWAQAAQVVDRL